MSPRVLKSRDTFDKERVTAMPTPIMLIYIWAHTTHQQLSTRIRHRLNTGHDEAGDDTNDRGWTMLEYVIGGAIAAVAVAAIATLIYNHYHDDATTITGQ